VGDSPWAITWRSIIVPLLCPGWRSADTRKVLTDLDRIAPTVRRFSYEDHPPRIGTI
jgi:hypothetical protein